MARGSGAVRLKAIFFYFKSDLDAKFLCVRNAQKISEKNSYVLYCEIIVQNVSPTLNA